MQTFHLQKIVIGCDGGGAASARSLHIISPNTSAKLAVWVLYNSETMFYLMDIILKLHGLST